jgi:hypothetical protein
MRTLLFAEKKIFKRGRAMQIPVWIEPMPGNGYRASGTFPFDLSAEGGTRDEALQKLHKIIQDHMANGAELLSLEVPRTDNPWVRLEGVYKDDPLFDEWQAAIAEYRREADRDGESS